VIMIGTSTHFPVSNHHQITMFEPCMCCLPEGDSLALDQILKPAEPGGDRSFPIDQLGANIRSCKCGAFSPGSTLAQLGSINPRQAHLKVLTISTCRDSDKRQSHTSLCDGAHDHAEPARRPDVLLPNLRAYEEYLLPSIFFHVHSVLSTITELGG